MVLTVACRSLRLIGRLVSVKTVGGHRAGERQGFRSNAYFALVAELLECRLVENIPTSSGGNACVTCAGCVNILYKKNGVLTTRIEQPTRQPTEKHH